MRKTDSNELVYSTDAQLNKRCTQCGKLPEACRCALLNKKPDIAAIRAVLRIEKAHRGGKDVTIIDHLPASESFLKELAQSLKKRCGTGGTYKIKENTGMVEIQGDKRDQVRSELVALGIKCR